MNKSDMKRMGVGFKQTWTRSGWHLESSWASLDLSFLSWKVGMLQEGGPLPGPKSGLLPNTQKWIVRGDTCADKARDFIGKGHPGGEQ